MVSSTLRPHSSNIDSLGTVKNLGFLKGWKQLKKLSVVGYPELNDITALADKTELKTLEINRCPKISDLEILKNLSSLRTIRIADCSFTEEHLEEISRALPECTVITEEYSYIGGEKNKRESRDYRTRRP